LNLVMTGPVTNLAVAMGTDREAVGRIGKIVVMGGSIREGGNVTPFAEFNAHSDPKALEIVVGSGLPVTMIPLDVTHRVRLLTCDIPGTRAVDAGVCSFLLEMTGVYRRFHLGANGFDGCLIHDPLTVAALVRPELFSFETMAVRVVTEGEEAGRTIGEAGGAAVEVAMGVNAKGCLELFWEALGGKMLNADW
jgi:purine nucleosidase